ncbi:unnamed protein product [Ilex paraguariensis]|uniref:Uncharacterized protein n=1 Tax=Ilex paraguariensis TaxID=185542 RepID=A0ABC8U525_9AQUA
MQGTQRDSMFALLMLKERDPYGLKVWISNGGCSGLELGGSHALAASEFLPLQLQAMDGISIHIGRGQ